jgi:hypothetical protein
LAQKANTKTRNQQHTDFSFSTFLKKSSKKPQTLHIIRYLPSGTETHPLERGKMPRLSGFSLFTQALAAPICPMEHGIGFFAALLTGATSKPRPLWRYGVP